MNILIFGATGGTGRNLVTQGLQKGHKITAFVRNPARLKIKDKNLSVIEGNILSQKDIDAAVKGQDVILSVLGNKTASALFRSNTIISDSVRNIILGMERQKVRRLLFVASFGVNKKIFLPEKLFIQIALKNIFADIPKQEKLIKESGLNWTIVHPARLVNTKRTGKYKADVDLSISLFSKIARSDVADFILNNINTSTFINKTVTLSY